MSEKNGPTPGPWRLFDCEYDGVIISSACGTVACLDIEKADGADARLIASAPDLLEALETLVDGVCDEPTSIELRKLAWAADSVIKKARGRG